MTQEIADFIVQIFGSNALLATFLLALFPVIELKGAIPFGMSISFWGENALSSWSALGIAFLGSSIIIPLVALIFRPIIKWLENYKFFQKIVSFVTDDIKNTSTIINSYNAKTETRKTLLKMLAVLIFVSFPVPLTGIWSGTCFGILLHLDFWQIFLSVLIGNFICGLIVTFVCMIFPSSTTIILYVFISLLFLMIMLKTMLHFIKKRKKKKEEKAE